MTKPAILHETAVNLLQRTKNLASARIGILPIFERAAARDELPDAFDVEGAFAMLSGAMHFRMIVMRETPDAAWVDRILELFSGLLAGSS